MKKSVFLTVVLIFLAVYFAMSFSHRLVIRRTMFIFGHPIGAFTTPIQEKPDSKDKRVGDCYVIKNKDINNGTIHALPGVCMKKNRFGFYYDISIGVF